MSSLKNTPFSSSPSHTQYCPFSTDKMKQFNNIGAFPVPEKQVKEQKRAYTNKLSSREMESLTAICDTFLPSIVVDSNSYDKSTLKFFEASPSMTGTPDLIGGLMSERLEHPKLWLMKIALWLLSTSLGTFVICGKLSLTAQFPYVQRFSQLPHDKREKILQSFQLSYFSLLRIFFKSMKFLTCLIFFSQVDENEKNVTWEGIGYCGPDPNCKIEPRVEDTHDQDADERREDIKKQKQHGPLYKGLLNLKQPTNIVADTLRHSGFPVTVHPQRQNKQSTLSNPSLTLQCDAVVIGSGSGGGVVAGVLAKAGYKVLVLEKGNYYARENLSLLEGPSMDQMYLSGCLLATDDMNAVILAGSTVGGGSTINWSASIQTPQHVLNEWSNDYELELFDSKMYQQATNVICKAMKVQTEVDEQGFNNAVLRKGCNKLGYPVTNVPQNTPPDHYCGWCSLGCRDGKKLGTSETWLVDLVDSGNGIILPGCEAIKVMHKREKGTERNTATGVAFNCESNGVKQICVVESKVTVVACGAICTPLLLKQSGLQNRNIGKNLHLHPVTMAWGYFPEELFIGKKSYEGGILTSMSTVVANFEESGYGAIIQTPSLHPGMFSALMPWESGKDIKAQMCRFSRTAHVLALARDKGSGTVTSSSSISYKLHKTDKENLTKGLEKMLRLLAAAGAEEIGTQHCEGRSINVKNATTREFERFVKEESERALKDSPVPVASAHQMGTCRMGINPKVSAVDPMGETWEVEKLYVADTSVFPTALGVNPMVTVQAIAYCTAQSILESLRTDKN